MLVCVMHPHALLGTMLMATKHVKLTTMQTAENKAKDALQAQTALLAHVLDVQTPPTVLQELPDGLLVPVNQVYAKLQLVLLDTIKTMIIHARQTQTTTVVHLVIIAMLVLIAIMVIA